MAEPPVITTPGNGKRWFADTLGKAIGGVLTVILLGLLALVATGRAYTIYGLPPRMDAAEKSIENLSMAATRRQPMTQAETDALADAIAARLPTPKKGKP